jgi:hypothetical protein
MTDEPLIVDTGTHARRVLIGDYLDAAADERATIAAHAWIKQVRHAAVDGQPLRRRFTVRGDSLWWFAELYLHKQGVIVRLFRAIAALEAMLAQERPVEIRYTGGSRLLRGVLPQIARARAVRYRGAEGFGWGWPGLARLDLRTRWLALAARASRVRPRRLSPAAASTTIAAFVHNAFWRSGSSEGSAAESYIGPVLQRLEERLGGAVKYVGLGPTANFRARRWWHVLRSRESGSVTPIEALAPLEALSDSSRTWRERHVMRRALWGSSELRQHAVIGGCDCWPVVREELAGIALLQWPWSARAMDESGAALDALRPAVALTYAEAGGWGRALMLECRRRGIPSAGLQHGFIYRHWLNYLHEPDEMLPDPGHPEDVGFPRPTVTLLFDGYARRHLEDHGRFPPQSLGVTGSPRLDALVQATASLTETDIARTREAAGAIGPRPLVLLVTKYREAVHVLPALAGAAAAMPDVQFAIKTHPAETPDAYEAIARSSQNIRVLPAVAPLAPLLRASRAVVTVNSTVALDAAVLGVPALVIGLPNNLSPFVDAGIMAGAPDEASIRPALERILYDEGFRLQLQGERGTYLARFGVGSDGRAAARSADAVLDLIRSGAPGRR